MKTEIGRDFDFKDVIKNLSKNLEVSYNNGDISDIGNEIGFQLGNILPNMTKSEIEDFIVGFKHGISLTNNTH